MTLQECLYLNAIDDIRYGYSKKFFMDDNKERYPDATPEQLAQAWQKAFEKMASDF